MKFDLLKKNFLTFKLVILFIFLLSFSSDLLADYITTGQWATPSCLVGQSAPSSLDAAQACADWTNSTFGHSITVGSVRTGSNPLKRYNCGGTFSNNLPCSFEQFGNEIVTQFSCDATNQGNSTISIDFQGETCLYAGTVVRLIETKGMPTDGVCPAGNPIHPATGNKFQQEAIIAANQGLLSFSLYYNSVDANDSGDLIIDGKWHANYFQSLRILGSIIMVIRPDQKTHQFRCISNGVCTGDTDSKHILEKTVNGFALNTENNVAELYDITGKLLSITPLSGETQTLSYNATTDLLETVTDAYGRTLTFTYDADDRLETVTDPDGEAYTYTYDAAGNLSSVIYPDETPASNADNPTRQYQYNDPNFDSLLTAIIDENGSNYASFGYDTEGRAIFSEHSGGAERVDLVYNADGTTTVTDSAGASNTFTFETVSFVPKTVGISGGQCGSGCSAQGQAQTYDANGFLASRTDFEGNVTNFINNTRGLQESRTEAVGTAEERTITTEWHPDFRLPTKITEPGKETLFTYDTQGRLLSRTEREI